jgi:hypothetical protein
MEFSRKEIILLLIGTMLAFASFKTDDPLLFFPCIGISWASFMYICVSHQGPIFVRVLMAFAISAFFIFLSFRTYKPRHRDLNTAELAITTKCQEAIVINKYRDTIFGKDAEPEDCPSYVGEHYELIQRGIIQCSRRFASKPLSRSNIPPGAPPGDKFEQFSQCFLTQKGKHLAEDLLYLREHPKIKVSRPMVPQPNFTTPPSPTPDMEASPR